MQEVRCKKCGRIIATKDKDTIYILCSHGNKKGENGYISGKCKTMNEINMNTKKESVNDERKP
jgi:phage FluMu protein Com